MRKQNGITIQQMFDTYCKWRLKVVKSKKDYDYCVEQFAKTELFQVNTTNNDCKLDVRISKGGLPFIKDYEKYALPFERQFVKLPNSKDISTAVFIGEFKPTITTGTLFIHLNGRYDATGFTIFSDGSVHIDFVKNDEIYKKSVTMAIMSALVIVFGVLTKLNKHTVIEDKPTGTTNYYRRKLAPTIKVVDRPIYYVLNKKYKETYNSVIRNPIGHLSPTHAFKVRGFWRIFNGKQLGKNRNGERVVEGYTWVKEHVRGQGDLKKKLRVVQ